jgi:methionyl aminopeptidase
MGIELKTADEIALMRQAGLVVYQVLEELEKLVEPGITLEELDQAARRETEQRGATCAFKDLYGFPKHICISVNDQVVHGIPGKRKLQEGDLVKLDHGAVVRGWYGDSARTVPVGKVSAEARKLLEVTRESLEAGIRAMVVGNRVSDIGAAVESVVAPHGYGIVRDYVGHGIGKRPHEDPQVPNYGPPGRRERLVPGMCLAIEPMVNVGRPEVRVLDDGWTAVTMDGSLSAHFELSLAVTRHGPWILSEPYPYGREEAAETAAHA